MSARLLGFLGVGTTVVWAAGCLGSAASINSEAGLGGASGAVYAPWGDAPPLDPKASAAGPSGTGTSSSTSSGSGGASFGAGGGGGPDQILKCDPDFQPTLTPVLIPYPGAKAMGTPALARALITAGETPALEAFAASEFLNYYQVKYPQAPSAAGNPDGLAVSAGIGQWLTATELVLQIGVQAPVRPRSHAVALTVVVDTSISMAGESMNRAHSALIALAGGLRAGDSFALLTTRIGGLAPTPIQVVAPSDPAVLMAASTVHVDLEAVDLGTAVAAAYDVAVTALDSSKLQRVVLITDGVAPPGSLNLGLVAGNLKFHDITLTGVGVGAATSYRSKLLAQATSVGSGANVYLDSTTEAENILGKRFDELMDTVVSDVDVTVTLPPFLQTEAQPPAQQAGGSSPSGFVTSQLGPGRSLVFRQVLVACNAGIVAVSMETIDIQARWRSFGASDYTLAGALKRSTSELVALDQVPIAKASAISTYAAALRDPLRKARLQVAHQFAVDPLVSEDDDVKQIRGLIESDLTYQP